MTEKRFTLFSDGETIIDNESVADDGGKEIYWTVEYIQLVKLVELLNELHEDKQSLIKEAKHQQEQKQRLVNYLQQYLNITEIREIMNKELE